MCRWMHRGQSFARRRRSNQRWPHIREGEWGSPERPRSRQTADMRYISRGLDSPRARPHGHRNGHRDGASRDPKWCERRSTSRHGRFLRMTARMPESVVWNVRLVVKNSVAPSWRPAVAPPYQAALRRLRATPNSASPKAPNAVGEYPWFLVARFPSSQPHPVPLDAAPPVELPPASSTAPELAPAELEPTTPPLEELETLETPEALEELPILEPLLVLTSLLLDESVTIAPLLLLAPLLLAQFPQSLLAPLLPPLLLPLLLPLLPVPPSPHPAMSGSTAPVWSKARKGTTYVASKSASDGP